MNTQSSTATKGEAGRKIVLSLFASMEAVGAEFHPFVLDDALRLAEHFGIPADDVPSEVRNYGRSHNRERD